MTIAAPAFLPTSTGATRRRVLFVERTTGFGGSTVGLAHLLRGIDLTRWEPLLLLSHETQRAWMERQGLGWVETAVVPMRPPRTTARSGNRWTDRLLRRLVDSPLAAADSYSRSLPCAQDLLRFIGDREIDLIHLNNGVSVNRAGIRVAKALGVPCVVKQRGFEWRSWDVARLAQQVDLFLPDSAAVAADVARLGVSRDRILVTYCAVDLPREPSPAVVAAARASLCVPDAAPVFGIVGCVQEWKGQHVFLAAAARVIAEIPGAVALVVGGPPSGAATDYSRSLVRQAAALGIADRVRFTGHRDDVPALLCAMDAVVHASTAAEPFGTIVAEAMALGRPVIASALGGPTEYVEPGVTGLLHAPGDAVGLADAVLRHLRERDAARRMAAAGRATSLRRFGAATHVERTFAAYERVIRGASRPNSVSRA